MEPGKLFYWTWPLDGKRTASIFVRAEPRNLVLKYTYNGRKMEYQVGIERVATYRGGARPLFKCPSCGKRANRLFLWGDGLFACRNCLGIALANDHQTPIERALRQAGKIRERLGWESHIYAARPKPKGMHWKTFYRLSERHDAYMRRADALFLESVGLPPEAADDSAY